ncbi:TPA: hypothetical protein ACTXAJ_004167 [Raoultella planticola]|uniref:hypothetical protein n=1 Tax=Raoultella ornithinolytica TaxID=54291 RepID=UPI0013E3F1ED|nr:hypothetical protein [Raoultella ornithinolytica]
MYKDESQLKEILIRGTKKSDPLTEAQKAYHQRIAEALGMTWEDYLEHNPQLK